MQDLRSCDLLIVMGTSLKVYPFAALVNDVSPTTPRLLINKDGVGPFKGCEINKKLEDDDSAEDKLKSDNDREMEKERFKNGRDIAWLGECDDGVQHLADLLHWQL
jgi:NAD+-dependent protein deacetylase sirtuin 2